MCVQMFVCVHAHVCVYMWGMCVRICGCIYIYMYTQVCACACVCVHVAEALYGRQSRCPRVLSQMTLDLPTHL